MRIEYASEAGVPFLQKKCGLLNLGTWKPVEGGVRWQWDNTYTTTIHAINSVVVKMSRLSKIKPLYRGWTDATLPKSFFEADGMGVKGGVEYGFSSTTTDRAQAAHYAQGKASTILELEMGMVDRGADIGARLPASALAPDTRFLPSRPHAPPLASRSDWLSQYPHEKETLLPPLMGLQVRGTSVDGRTLVVDCRISINMASQTLEQVAGKRKMLLGDVRRLWEARTSGQALAAHANALRMHARARARLCDRWASRWRTRRAWASRRRASRRSWWTAPRAWCGPSSRRC